MIRTPSVRTTPDTPYTTAYLGILESPRHKPHGPVDTEYHLQKSEKGGALPTCVWVGWGSPVVVRVGFTVRLGLGLGLGLGFTDA